MAAWRNTYACSDVNDDESLNSECEDEVLSSEQLEISTDSDRIFKRINSKIEVKLFAKGGKEGRKR